MGMSGKGGKKDAKRATTSDKMSLLFKPTQIKRVIKNNTRMRVSRDATVACAVALGYIGVELIDGGKNVALNDGKKKMTPKNIATAITADLELSTLFKNCLIQSGGCRNFSLLMLSERIEVNK